MERAALPAYPGDLLMHLHAFSALAGAIEGGSGRAFFRAAMELGLDVSVLRRRMQTLTEHVGAPLVGGRGAALTLTTEGARTRDKARRILELAADLRAAPDEEGPLRVACTGTFHAELLPAALAAMRARHPRLRWRVRRAGAEASLALIKQGELDIAIVRGAEAPLEVSARRVGEDRLWLAVPEESELAKAKRLSLDALAGATLVGYSRASSTMRRVMQVLAPLGATPWIEVDGKAAALAYVAAGLGVAFVSLLAGQKPERRGVVARDVTALFPRISFWLVWPKHAKLDGYRATFVERVMALRRGAPAGASSAS